MLHPYRDTAANRAANIVRFHLASIDMAAENLGIPLLDWQRDYLAAALDNPRMVMVRSRRTGWQTIATVLTEIEGEARPVF